MMEKENSSTLYDFTGMQAYTPPAGYAIPSNALKGLLISSNGSITWIYTGDDGFIDIGGYSDWVIDPQDDLSNYQLFSADGFVNNDNDNSSKYFVSMNR